MSVMKIKQYLNSPDKIALLLERLKLRHIKMEQGDTLITCGLPNSGNNRSVQIRLNSNLSMNIRSINIQGDVIDLVSFMTFSGFGDVDQQTLRYLRSGSVRWLEGSLDGDFDEFEFDSDYEYRFENDSREPNQENIVYDNRLLREFSTIPHIDWIKEGFKSKTLEEFDIRYNYMDDQIVIPCRNSNGELVSLKARNMNIKKTEYFETPKYISILRPKNGVDIYGLWKTKKYIKKKKQVIIFESEKSVIKAWQFGFRNSVALATNNLSRRHFKQLKEFIEDGYEVVIALDNDMEMIDIKSISNKFKKMDVIVKYIKQSDNNWHVKLDEKDSPVDKGKRLFKKLYDSRRGLI